MPKNFDVFISYAKEDYDSAKRIRDDLSNNGARVWLDSTELLPGQNWKIAIHTAIKESVFFLLLLSSNSISKVGYVQKEQKIALDIFNEFPEGEIFIIPVRLDDSQPTDEKLMALHWVDLHRSYENGIKQIMRVLNRKSDNIETSKPKLIEKQQETLEEAKLTEFEAFYLVAAIRNRAFMLKQDRWLREPTGIVLLYFLALDSIGERKSTDINPYQAKVIGGHETSLEEKFAAYEKINIYVRMTLAGFITEKLRKISKCFEAEYMFVNQFGIRKLKDDYPELCSELNI